MVNQLELHKKYRAFVKTSYTLSSEMELSKFQKLFTKVVILNILQATDSFENPIHLISQGFSALSLLTFGTR